VAGKRSRNQDYEVHGEDVASLLRGFSEIGMPEHRRALALEIVRDVLAVNAAVDFYWYCTLSDSEICCYWDDASQNQMWINATGVLLLDDESLAKRPERTRTYFMRGSMYSGWLLPGAEMGSGSGTRTREIPTVNCPETFLPLPAGSICPHCEVKHG
jgi:hypothetical protein